MSRILLCYSAAGMANPDALYQVAIFNGDFLDTRYALLVLTAPVELMTIQFYRGVRCLPRIRLLRIRLHTSIRAEVDSYERIWNHSIGHLLRMFALLVTGTPTLLMSEQSYGPLFPFAQYTLLNSMLTSIACYIAIALIFITFAFPESLNHSYLDSSTQLLDKLKDIMALQEDILRSDPHDVGAGSPLATKATMARVGMLTQLQQCKYRCFQRLARVFDEHLAYSDVAETNAQPGVHLGTMERR